jgi:hypothetical protein
MSTYSDAVSNMEVAEVRSEFQRSFLLVTLFSLILVVSQFLFPE